MSKIYYYKSIYLDAELTSSPLIQVLFVVDASKLSPDLSMTGSLLCRPQSIVGVLSTEMFLRKNALIDWIKQSMEHPSLEKVNATEVAYVVIECLARQFSKLAPSRSMYHIFCNLYMNVSFDVRRPHVSELDSKRTAAKSAESRFAKKLR